MAFFLFMPRSYKQWAIDREEGRKLHFISFFCNINANAFVFEGGFVSIVRLLCWKATRKLSLDHSIKLFDITLNCNVKRVKKRKHRQRMKWMNDRRHDFQANLDIFDDIKLEKICPSLIQKRLCIYTLFF